MKLSAPYNHDPELLDALTEMAGMLASVYLPFHPAVALSARSFRGAPTARGYAAELRRVAHRLGQLDLGMHLVANSPAWGVDAMAVVASAERLRDLVPRLLVSFADLAVARQVSQRAPWLAIGASCLARIESPVEAMWWRELASASHVTVSREINRRPDRLAALRGLGMTLGVVCFDDCIPGCPFARRHFQRGGAGGAPGEFHARCEPTCVEIRRRRPWLLAQKEILPGHLSRLGGLVDEVKISGRDAETSEVLRRVRLYARAESLEHPNGHYTEPSEAWEVLSGCPRNCAICGWCAEHIGRSRTDRTEPAWEAVFQGPQGGRVRLWLAAPSETRPPVRRVVGLGLYYGSSGTVDAAVIEALTDLLAALLGRDPGAAEEPRRLAAALTSVDLPGGFRLRSVGRERDERSSLVGGQK